MGKKDGKTGFQLKVPKGTKDCEQLRTHHRATNHLRGANLKRLGEGTDMVVRDKIFTTITDVFKRHGAVTIDT